MCVSLRVRVSACAYLCVCVHVVQDETRPKHARVCRGTTGKILMMPRVAHTVDKVEHNSLVATGTASQDARTDPLLLLCSRFE